MDCFRQLSKAISKEQKLEKLFDLQGLVAVITGGKRGIGRSITRGLVEMGVKVIVVGKSPDADSFIKEMDPLHHANIDYIACDLQKSDNRKDLGRKIIEKSHRIDILINNAGDQTREPFLNYSQEQWEYDMQLLLTSVFDVSQQIASMMIAQNICGKIINIGSISSFQGAKNIVGYVTAKHGLIGLTKSMAIELAPFNINVNCIAPGFIETELLHKYTFDKDNIQSRLPVRRIGKPEDIVGTVVYLCSDASRYVTGITIPDDGGWLAR